VDPTGHFTEEEIQLFLQQTYHDDWWSFWIAWSSDDLFMEMLGAAEYGDVLFVEGLGSGFFQDNGSTFAFEHQGAPGERLDLTHYQGNGPYTLTRGEKQIMDGSRVLNERFLEPNSNRSKDPYRQPVYDYNSGKPVFTGKYRIASYVWTGKGKADFLAAGSVPYAVDIAGVALTALGVPWLGIPTLVAGSVTTLHNAAWFEYELTVSYEEKIYYYRAAPGLLEVVEP